jgi:glutamate-ammonia-ligase adenylyltransferase
MRERMRENKSGSKPGQFDLKQDRGGIADIEFIVQYGVLSSARTVPSLLRYTDNIRLLSELSESDRISRSEAALLADAYRAYRGRAHRATLQQTPAIVAVAELGEMSKSVAEIWQRLMLD